MCRCCQDSCFASMRAWRFQLIGFGDRVEGLRTSGHPRASAPARSERRGLGNAACASPCGIVGVFPVQSRPCILNERIGAVLNSCFRGSEHVLSLPRLTVHRSRNTWVPNLVLLPGFRLKAEGPDGRFGTATCCEATNTLFWRLWYKGWGYWQAEGHQLRCFEIHGSMLSTGSWNTSCYDVA